LIVVLVLTSGLLGGALGAYFGRSNLEILFLAAGFGFLTYLVLVSFALIMMYTALHEIKRMNNE
jgi:hypothetical protein